LESGTVPFLEDSKGLNTLVQGHATYHVQEDTGDYMQGLCCGKWSKFGGGYLKVDNDDLDQGFPGTDQYKSFTLLFRLKLLAVDEVHYLMDKGGGVADNYSYRIVVSAANKLTLDISADGAAPYTSYAHASSLSVNTWYSVAVVYDNTNLTYRIRIEDDSTGLILGTDKTGTAIDLYMGTGSFKLGYPNGFAGKLDEVVVFNDTLMPGTIDSIFSGEYENPNTEIPALMNKDLIDPYVGGAWLWLCELNLPGYTVIRMARNTENITYAGHIFVKNNFDPGQPTSAGDGSVPQSLIRIAQDRNYTIEDIIDEKQGAPNGRVKLIRAHEDFLTSEITELEDDYDILGTESDTEWIIFRLGIPSPLLKRVPLRIYSSKMCPYAVPSLFKGIECQYTGDDTTCKGTLIDCISKDNAEHWGGEAGLDPNVTKG